MSDEESPTLAELAEEVSGKKRKKPPPPPANAPNPFAHMKFGKTSKLKSVPGRKAGFTPIFNTPKRENQLELGIAPPLLTDAESDQNDLPAVTDSVDSFLPPDSIPDDDGDDDQSELQTPINTNTNMSSYHPVRAALFAQSVPHQDQERVAVNQSVEPLPENTADRVKAVMTRNMMTVLDHQREQHIQTADANNNTTPPPSTTSSVTNNILADRRSIGFSELPRPASGIWRLASTNADDESGEVPLQTLKHDTNYLIPALINRAGPTTTANPHHELQGELVCEIWDVLRRYNKKAEQLSGSRPFAANLLVDGKQSIVVKYDKELEEKRMEIFQILTNASSLASVSLSGVVAYFAAKQIFDDLQKAIELSLLQLVPTDNTTNTVGTQREQLPQQQQQQGSNTSTLQTMQVAPCPDVTPTVEVPPPSGPTRNLLNVTQVDGVGDTPSDYNTSITTITTIATAVITATATTSLITEPEQSVNKVPTLSERVVDNNNNDTPAEGQLLDVEMSVSKSPASCLPSELLVNDITAMSPLSPDDLESVTSDGPIQLAQDPNVGVTDPELQPANNCYELSPLRPLVDIIPNIQNGESEDVDEVGDEMSQHLLVENRPDFSVYETHQLASICSKFGIRSGSRLFMISKLNNIVAAKTGSVPVAICTELEAGETNELTEEEPLDFNTQTNDQLSQLCGNFGIRSGDRGFMINKLNAIADARNVGLPSQPPPPSAVAEHQQTGEDCLDFSTQTHDQLSQLCDNFGIKPGNRDYMINKLNAIADARNANLTSQRPPQRPDEELLDFSNHTYDQLSQLCRNFGIKPGSKTFMISKLNVISEAKANPSQAVQPQQRSEREDVRRQKASEMLETMKMVMTATEDFGSSSDGMDLYTKVLMYEPIDQDALFQAFIDSGLKVTKTLVQQFVNEHKIPIRKHNANWRR
eukprot:TRINITY_DN10458_c0_g1_i1.p1 TRINITY_DN10458_c0_g1~~TRINITY_DN10458_c0_g1_i1.p1  ORF type:complete len:929 (+),score=241.46 TRINITY_DN10458_c0_g1_i1:73-2859(+)